MLTMPSFKKSLIVEQFQGNITLNLAEILHEKLLGVTLEVQMPEKLAVSWLMG